jgi:sugar fermentation stimulation protein A
MEKKEKQCKLQQGEVLFDLNSMGEIVKGNFVSRPNRFIGKVTVQGEEKICHIADTGRLKEILTSGREVLLSKNRPSLKTDYKLLGCKMEHMVLINTSVHSKITLTAMKKGLLGYVPKSIATEIKVENSRLDFLIDKHMYVELKGSNLLIENTCKFPDAPTMRGTKHIEKLIKLKKSGFDAKILIISMRKCSYFSPYRERDENFANAFYKALKLGVEFQGFKVKINEQNNTVVFNGELKLKV